MKPQQYYEVHNIIPILQVGNKHRLKITEQVTELVMDPGIEFRSNKPQSSCYNHQILPILPVATNSD